MPPEVEDYDFKGVTAVYTFTQGVRKVQIISTYGAVLSLILGFHSSKCPWCQNLYPNLTCHIISRSDELHHALDHLRPLPPRHLRVWPQFALKL